MLLHDRHQKAIIGLALSYSLQVTGTMNFAVRQAVEVEVNANSIERLDHYIRRLDREAPYVIDDSRPPKDWPTDGKIEAHDLVIKYAVDGPEVLKNLTFTINAREKVGIVGRTGMVVMLQTENCRSKVCGYAT